MDDTKTRPESVALRDLYPQLAEYQLKEAEENLTRYLVQFFLNETKSKHELSRFWLWDSRFENPVVDREKPPPYLPQD